MNTLSFCRGLPGMSHTLLFQRLNPVRAYIIGTCLHISPGDLDAIRQDCSTDCDMLLQRRKGDISWNNVIEMLISPTTRKMYCRKYQERFWIMYGSDWFWLWHFYYSLPGWNLISIRQCVECHCVIIIYTCTQFTVISHQLYGWASGITVMSVYPHITQGKPDEKLSKQITFYPFPSKKSITIKCLCTSSDYYQEVMANSNFPPWGWNVWNCT